MNWKLSAIWILLYAMVKLSILVNTEFLSKCKVYFVSITLYQWVFRNLHREIWTICREIISELFTEKYIFQAMPKKNIYLLSLAWMTLSFHSNTETFKQNLSINFPYYRWWFCYHYRNKSLCICKAFVEPFHAESFQAKVQYIQYILTRSIYSSSENLRIILD